MSAQEKLLDKLEELKVWQEQEQKRLLDKQQTQRKHLNEEQAKLYEILGIPDKRSSEKSANESLISVEEDEFAEYRIEEENIQELEEEEYASEVEVEIEMPKTKKSAAAGSSKIISPLRNFDLDKISIAQNTEAATNIVKRPFLKRGAGLTTRFRVHPDTFKLENVPKYKYANRINNFRKKNGNISDKSNRTKPQERRSLEKDVPGCSKSINQSEDIGETPKLRHDQRKIAPKTIAWENILNPSSFSGTSIDLSNLKDKFQKLDEYEKRDLDNINIIELLEKGLNDSSLMGIDSSMILKVLEALRNPDEENEEKEEETENENDESAVNVSIEPHPNDLKKKIIVDESSESSGEEEEDSRDHRVRFSDDVIVVDDDQEKVPDDTLTDAETILSTDLDAIELSKTSTPNEKLEFFQFKKKMIGKKQFSGKEKVKNFLDSCDPQNDLRERGNIMENRIKELEKEILIFREKNALVTTLKQELELAKIQLESDREDMLDKFKDEKIKIEIFLHDERLKIEDEKKKCEKMLRDAKINPNRKEREEIAKLKQTIEELREEAKTKENRYGSSQARFRSQVKQLEKDNQLKTFEIEALKKEIRKLESENSHLRRDNSSKMLQEINKNIQKLTPPAIAIVPEEPKKKPQASLALKKNQVENKNRKRFVSEPDLTSKDEVVKQDSSTDDSDEDVFKQKSSYFRSTRKVKSKENKENLPAARRSDPVKSTSDLLAKRVTEPINSENVLESMKREIDNPDGSKDIWYPNGNLKKISPDGMMIRMLYYNKDIKETNMIEGTIRYYYADRNTWHTTYIDGLEILEYPDGQMEHRYKDGTVELHYSNGSIRITNPKNTEDLKEEWRYSDGSNIKIYNNNTKIVHFPNGQREIHTANNSRREFSDGTVKIVYKDGSQETRYSNGRIRIKDKDGKLISDTQTQCN